MSHIALLSNITTGILEQTLKQKGYDIYTPEGYNTWIMDVLNKSSMLYAAKFDAAFILIHGDVEADNWTTLEDGFAQMEQWLQALNVLCENMKDTSVFVSNLDIPTKRIKPMAERRYEYAWEYKWYEMLQNLCEEKRNLYIFDLKALVAETGRAEIYSSKMWYMGNMPFSMKGIKLLADEIDSIVGAAKGQRKKCIALDLDNTLWGGVAGEDGINGICLDRHKEGKRYYDFQQRIKEIKECGIILSVVSKNNIEDASEIIDKHEDMVLRNEDFAASRINWETKPENIADIANELNIGIDSFVFVDDNPAEREMMKAQLSNVVVPEFPKDTAKLSDFATEIYKKYFRTVKTTAEDKVKTELYHQEAARKEVLKAAGSLEEYIITLELEADIHLMKQDEADRVAQLCNKTNQFNVTTKRYGIEDINKMSVSDEYAIYTAHTRDKFGDNGLTAVLILRFNEMNIIIDSFLMSCRVMGRFLENIMFNHIMKIYADSYKSIEAEYIRTAKNLPVEKLYDKLGMEMISENEKTKQYKSDFSILNLSKCNYKQVVVNSREAE